MNELKVIVQQKVGQITWNYEELKSALAVEMEKYKNIVYDDNLITTAKSDVAFLRKLKKEVSDRRIEVKKQCLKPYELIETQAKELTALIDEPITEIDKQIKEYEEQQKSLRRQEISDFMDEAFADLPQEVITKLKNKIYDTKWENKSAKRRTGLMRLLQHTTMLQEIYRLSPELMKNSERWQKRYITPIWYYQNHSIRSTNSVVRKK